jgi:ADP-ribose pyrophosphatase YjhB (NUDIX family)
LLVVSNEGVDWFLPGGWIEPLELVKFGCEREVFEETGLNVVAQKAIFVEESIADNIEKFGNILHRIDIFCVCTSNDAHLQEWEDVDPRPITKRKFISQTDWNKSFAFAPRALQKLSFDEIKSMPECYSWRSQVPEKYSHLIKSDSNQ